MIRKRAFDPVVDARTQVLILGSLPGDVSLAHGQYYAPPQNGCWRRGGHVIDEPDLFGMAYADRLSVLKGRGVGLWDVIVEAARVGSLDSAIRLPEYADLKTLVAALPRLRAIAFNGGKSAKAGGRHLGPDDGRFTRIVLPSSSPAHARMRREDKIRAWSVLGGFLDV